MTDPRDRHAPGAAGSDGARAGAGGGAPYRTQADLGGQPCCDAVVPEPEGRPFHAAWEPRALALTLAMGATGAWNLDMSRAARETLPDYRRLGYYQIWLAALQRLMGERGLIEPREIEQGRLLGAPRPVPRRLPAAEVAAALARGSPTERAAPQPARFAVGQPVRTRCERPAHHTRLPGYACGKRGLIERVHGAHVFADAHARGLGEQPQWLYTVMFEAAELWGDEARAGDRVSIDAWEPYLEPV